MKRETILCRAIVTLFEGRPYYGAASRRESSSGSGTKQRSAATTLDFHPRPSIHSDLLTNERNSLRHFCISLVTCICPWRPPVWDTCNLVFSERACDLPHHVRSSPLAPSTRTPRLIRACTGTPGHQQTVRVPFGCPSVAIISAAACALLILGAGPPSILRQRKNRW